MIKSIIILILFYIISPLNLLFAECVDDILKKNIDSGKYLDTYSGNLFQTLDSISAMLWLPITSLKICGPNSFDYKGTRYEIFKVINTDDGESVEALLVKGKGISSKNSDCYESVIIKPSPFMGNNGEIFVLTNGSVWEIMYEYEYMYEYNPTIIACPTHGYIIVKNKKLDANQIKE